VGAWLRDNFPGSAETARGYARIAKRRPEVEANRQRVADLSLLGTLKALSEPRGERERARPDVLARLGKPIDAFDREAAAPPPPRDARVRDLPAKAER
jgi:hypothetical protein